MRQGNLFEVPGLPGAEEVFETLAEGGQWRLERIVSHGHATPEGTWLEQPQDEWVVLLQGAAELAFEAAPPRVMAPGEWVWLPAGCRHRVQWTDAERPTVWLALHVAPQDGRSF